MKRRQYLTAVGTGATMTFAGCAGAGDGDDGGDQNGGATATQAEPPTVKVGAAGSGSTGVLTEVTVGEELDLENGVNIEPQRAAPPQVFQQIANRGVEVAMFGIQATAAARAEGREISIYGPWLANHNSLVVLADSDFESWEDLRGERIGILPPSSAQHHHARIRVSLMDDWGPLAEEFDLRTGNPGAIHSLNEQGEVSAHFGFIPPSVAALVSGTFREIEYLPDAFERDWGHNPHYVGLAAWDEFIDANTDTAINIRHALQDAAQLLNDDPATYLRRYRDVSGYSSDEEVEFAVDRTPSIYPTEWGDQGRENVREQLRRSRDLGALPEDAPTDVIADVG